jgi:hypothetical protein
LPTDPRKLWGHRHRLEIFDSHRRESYRCHS